jgi:hypothetical protein
MDQIGEPAFGVCIGAHARNLTPFAARVKKKIGRLILSICGA